MSIRTTLLKLGAIGAIGAVLAAPLAAKTFYLNFDVVGEGAQSIYPHGSAALTITTADTASMVDGRTGYAITSVYGTAPNYFLDNTTYNVEKISASDYLFTSGPPVDIFPGLSLLLNDGATVNLLGFPEYGIYYSIQYTGFFRGFETRNITLTEDGVTPPVANVPEPASWALLITGFGFVGATVRRRPKAIGPAR